MCEIKCTIRFSFSNEAEKPNMGEIVNFVKALDADPSEIEAAYRIAEERSLFLKFKSEASMRHALTYNSEDLIFHYGNGKEARVCMSHAAECIQYVRVYDLPPEVPDQEIASVLAKYGKVKRVVREKFPAELSFDVHTGVRGVYMDVKKEIPTALHFLNRKGNIFYPGNKDKCFHCKADGHQMNSCPKRKNRDQPDKRQHQKGQHGSTYATTVSGGAVAAAAIAAAAVAGGIQSGSNHQSTAGNMDEEMKDADTGPAADISEDEADSNVNKVYQIAAKIATEIKKRNELKKRAEEEERAKLRSPPKKKNK